MAKQEKLAEGFLTAIRSLPKRDRDLLFIGLLKDKNLRHDLIDLATIEERRKESSRPFRHYLKALRVLRANTNRWEVALRSGKYSPTDAFVITAYLTDTVKAGEVVWPKK